MRESNECLARKYVTSHKTHHVNRAVYTLKKVEGKTELSPLPGGGAGWPLGNHLLTRRRHLFDHLDTESQAPFPAESLFSYSGLLAPKMTCAFHRAAKV